MTFTMTTPSAPLRAIWGIALVAGIVVNGVEPSRASPAGNRSGATPPSKPLFSRITQAEFEKLDCKTQGSVYRQSLDCFAPAEKVPLTHPQALRI